MGTQQSNMRLLINASDSPEIFTESELKTNNIIHHRIINHDININSIRHTVSNWIDVKQDVSKKNNSTDYIYEYNELLYNKLKKYYNIDGIEIDLLLIGPNSAKFLLVMYNLIFMETLSPSRIDIHVGSDVCMVLFNKYYARLLEMTEQYNIIVNTYN